MGHYLFFLNNLDVIVLKLELNNMRIRKRGYYSKPFKFKLDDLVSE